MKSVAIEDLQNIYMPASDSHKGQNGRLLVIGGSHLFHAASLWSLTVASRIVDLVHYSSVPGNNEIVQRVKEEFRNGIVVPREHIEDYIEEDDCILIGPGMMRNENSKLKIQNSKLQPKVQNLKEILSVNDEGEQTEALTNYLLKKYPNKRWVIDAGALQMMDVNLIPPHAILTPHHGEFASLLKRAEVGISDNDALRSQKNLDPSSVSFSSVHDQYGKEKVNPDKIFSLPAHQEMSAVQWFAKQYNCIMLMKGEKDIASDGTQTRVINGGNVGMTKGGTGDVLAGLIAALACKNDPFLAAIAGSFINKKAGDALYKTVGPYFNATDLANEIPKTMKNLFIPS